jgi:hypothetical protein
MGKNIALNTLFFHRVGNATAKAIGATVLPSSGWNCIALSVSIAGGGLLAAGEFAAYYNGQQVSTTLTGNVASAGSGLDSNRVLLGALTKVPARVHHGWLSNVIIWNRPIDNDILDLMRL